MRCVVSVNHPLCGRKKGYWGVSFYFEGWWDTLFLNSYSTSGDPCMKKIISIISVTYFVFAASFASAHCEMPCGIYGDQARMDAMQEDADTIEKAMKKIQGLSREKKTNFNQLVRWIQTKEDHANKIQETISQYFLTQRIKEGFGEKTYSELLKKSHQVLVLAMKTKQEVNLNHVKNLKAVIHDFEHMYEKAVGQKAKK